MQKSAFSASFVEEIAEVEFKPFRGIWQIAVRHKLRPASFPTHLFFFLVTILRGESVDTANMDAYLAAIFSNDNHL